MAYLISISIALSLLYSVIIITKNRGTLANYILASFFLMASINLGYLFANYQYEGGFYIPFVTEFHHLLTVVYGIVIFLYTKASVQLDFKLKSKDFSHFAFLIPYLLLIFLGRYTDMKIIFNWYLPYIFKILVNVVYLFVAFIYLKRLAFSEPLKKKNKAHRNWLLWLIIGGLVVSLISIVGFVTNKFMPALATASGDYFLGAFLGIFLFMLGFMAFKNTNVFQYKWVGRHQNTSLAKIKSEDFIALQSFMEERKPYLNPHLSIHKLAEAIDIPKSKLSRLIVDNGYNNFYHFVNFYRVKEVQKMLLNNQNSHLSIFGIALDSGFNSKASINRVFKNFTGLKPSVYQKQSNNNNHK